VKTQCSHQGMKCLCCSLWTHPGSKGEPGLSSHPEMTRHPTLVSEEAM
jgi:hypothetical protein